MRKKMKKRAQSLAVALTMSLACWGQYAEPVQFPVADLYDTGVMNAYARALVETEAIRKNNFQQYVNWAFEAWDNKKWPLVVRYIDGALGTGYWNADLYYMRGWAYENLGDLKAAKKDYKKGKKKGSSAAANALSDLTFRMKK